MSASMRRARAVERHEQAAERRTAAIHAFAGRIATDWRLLRLGLRFCPACGQVTAAGLGYTFPRCTHPFCVAEANDA